MSRLRIEELDSNFKTAVINDEGVNYYNVLNNPSIVYGLPWFASDREYCRIAQDRLGKFPEGVRQLSWNTSGVRLKFRTNSPSVVLKVKLLSGSDMSHMPRSGISGFDFYIGSGNCRKYLKTIMPECGSEEYRGEADSGDCTMKEWLVFFPLYNGVRSLQLGISGGYSIEPAERYSVEKPIVFYGSSITQGGCASRTGNCYPNIISRWLDADIYNLGFSGNAKGELEMAELISEVDMSAFVFDYDHNAPSIEHLEKTHEPFFQYIRSKKPGLPVILVSKPDFDADIAVNGDRRAVIYRTYQKSIDSGDTRTYFVDGETLFGTKDRDSCTVDGCHPNDLGFMRMAKVICPVIRKALAL